MPKPTDTIPVELTVEEIRYICRVCENGFKLSKKHIEFGTAEWKSRAAKTMKLYEKLKFALKMVEING